MKHILLIALMALCAPAMASDDLSCRFLDVAADKSHASSPVEDFSEQVKTSIGTVSWSLDAMGQAVPALDGKVLPIDKENQGSFLTGKILETNGRLVLSYLVVRMLDSQADPSQMTLLIDANGKLIEQHLVPGEQMAGYSCRLAG